VQFQKDERLYERIFAETALYFYRNGDGFSDWQVVVIYPNQGTEQARLPPHRNFVNSDQVHRIYLNELGDIRELPLWVALMVLTSVSEAEAPAEARYLIGRAEQAASAEETRAIIEMVTTTMSYKFKKMTTREVEAILDITFEETRVYQEITAEADQKGQQKAASRLILRMLTKRFGPLEEEIRSAVGSLSLEKLETLSEALLDFGSLSDLDEWFTQNPEGKAKQAIIC
jgi:predicted transposase YdaD